MKKNVLKLNYLLLIFILIQLYLFPLSFEKLKNWLNTLPEFDSHNFFYINEKTNKQIDHDVEDGKKINWKYYDSKHKMKSICPKD